MSPETERVCRTNISSHLWLSRKEKEMEQTTFDKVKQFLSEHQKEIIYISAGIFIYRLGFNKGVKTTENAVIHFCNEAAKATS